MTGVYNGSYPLGSIALIWYPYLLIDGYEYYDEISDVTTIFFYAFLLIYGLVEDIGFSPTACFNSGVETIILLSALFVYFWFKLSLGLLIFSSYLFVA